MEKKTKPRQGNVFQINENDFSIRSEKPHQKL